MDLDNFLERLEDMKDAIGPYAKAKADRVYIENYLRCKKSLLMGQCDEKTVAAKEMYAYAHKDYIELLEGLRAAIEFEEKCRWTLEQFKMSVDIWRSVNANDRWIKNQV